MELERILGVQILFLGCFILGYHSGNMDSALAQKYLQIIASIIANLLASQGFELACIAICTAVKSKKLPKLKLKEKYKLSMYVLLLTIPNTVCCGHSLLREEFLMLWMAYALVRYLQLKRQPATITYGEALACSFAEGYLVQVIPPGGEWLRGIGGSYKGCCDVPARGVPGAAAVCSVPALPALSAQPRNLQQA